MHFALKGRHCWHCSCKYGLNEMPVMGVAYSHKFGYSPPWQSPLRPKQRTGCNRSTGGDALHFETAETRAAEWGSLFVALWHLIASRSSRGTGGHWQQLRGDANPLQLIEKANWRPLAPDYSGNHAGVHLQLFSQRFVGNVVVGQPGLQACRSVIH